MVKAQRRQTEINHHETAMQAITALGVAANRIARVCPKEFKNCRDAAKRADDLLKGLRAMPKWKRWLLNHLI